MATLAVVFLCYAGLLLASRHERRVLGAVVSHEEFLVWHLSQMLLALLVLPAVAGLLLWRWLGRPPLRAWSGPMLLLLVAGALELAYFAEMADTWLGERTLLSDRVLAAALGVAHLLQWLLLLSPAVAGAGWLLSRSAEPPPST